MPLHAVDIERMYVHLCMQANAAVESRPGDVFPAHLSLVEINRGLKAGKYVQGKFHPSRDNCLEAYVAVYDRENQVQIHLLLD